MKALRNVVLGVMLIAGLASAAPARAGDSARTRHLRERVSRGRPVATAPYYHETRIRGGWFALNYKYFWNHAPYVSYDEPYDYNGNYFPHPLPRH
jgi:hypothetical protein